MIISILHCFRRNQSWIPYQFHNLINRYEFGFVDFSVGETRCFIPDQSRIFFNKQIPVVKKQKRLKYRWQNVIRKIIFYHRLANEQHAEMVFQIVKHFYNAIYIIQTAVIPTEGA